MAPGIGKVSQDYDFTLLSAQMPKGVFSYLVSLWRHPRVQDMRVMGLTTDYDGMSHKGQGSDQIDKF